MSETKRFILTVTIDDDTVKHVGSIDPEQIKGTVEQVAGGYAFGADVQIEEVTNPSDNGVD